MPLLRLQEFRDLKMFVGIEWIERYIAKKAIAREMTRMVRDEGTCIYPLRHDDHQSQPLERACT